MCKMYSFALQRSHNLWMIPGLVLASIFSLKWLMNDKSLKIYILIGFAAFIFYYGFMYFLVSPNLTYAQLIIPSILRGFGMGVLFIGVWLYALGNLSINATLGAAAVLIIVRTMIGPGLWSLIFNYFDGIWSLEALTSMGGKIDASAYSRRMAMGLFRGVNLEALMISTKRIYGVLIMLGGAVLVYVSVLHMDGLDKRGLVLLRKRLKRQKIKGYNRKAKIRNTEEISEVIAEEVSEEGKAVAGTAS